VSAPDALTIQDAIPHVLHLAGLTERRIFPDVTC
jgi:hypothetical protein